MPSIFWNFLSVATFWNFLSVHLLENILIIIYESRLEVLASLFDSL
jgi:hypothetical protein